MNQNQVGFQPCLCLCRASLQITRIVPLRLIILQFRQIRFTDALTFITNSELHTHRKGYNYNRPGNLVPLKLAFFINESYCCVIK